MPNVQRNVVNAPNEPTAAGNRKANGFVPLIGEASSVRPSNESGARGDRRNGSADMTEVASPVTLPDHRFRVEDAKMPQPPSAFEPGKGAVPVNPSVPSGQGINRVYPVADFAKPIK